MKNLLILMTCILLVMNARSQYHGIRFEHGLSWEQLKAKAKAENKYIFVDAYTTWCAPCKLMDREVYPNDTVGDHMNEKFISLKVQMDSTGRDNEEVKRWYADARFLNREYRIQGFPGFLFFNSAGTLIYKDGGYKNVPDFINLINNAVDPKNIIFYSKLEDYKNGKKDYAEMYELIQFVKGTLGDDELAKQIAEDYINHTNKKQLLTQQKILFVKDVARNRNLADGLAREYIDKILNTLSEDEFFTWDNLRFLELFNHLITSKDRVFQLSYSKPQKIDSARKSRGSANRYVQSVIIKEEIAGRLFKNDKAIFKNPDWGKMHAMIKEKYPKFDVNVMLLNYQIYYYSKIKDCQQWAKYKSGKIKLELSEPVSQQLFFELNDLGAWEAFLSCSDETVLTKALEWIDLAIKLNNNNYGFLDTRANILYKLGRVKEAIAQEEKAVEMIMAFAAQEGSDVEYLIEHAAKYKEVIATMKKNEPTYINRTAAWDAKSLQRIRSTK